MPEATVRRRRTPSSLWFVLAFLVAIPFGMFAQAPAPAQGRGGGGQRGGAPAGAPAAPGAPPAAGAPAAAPAGQGGRGGQGGGAPAAPANARTAAPVDLTGYWVSVVTEDWIERMSPDSPPSGVGRGGRGGAAAAAAPAVPPTEPCRVYAAGGSMRVPGRLNITWADDNTLKIEMDAGTQTRLLRFNAPAPPSGEKTLQGYSAATWEVGGGGRGGGGRGGGGGAAAGPPPVRWGKLNVVTTNMKGGYLLSSRSSYSENAVLTEYFSRHTDFGIDYLTITANVQDGNASRVVSSTFKKEPNGAKFSPTPCEIVR